MHCTGFSFGFVPSRSRSFARPFVLSDCCRFFSALLATFHLRLLFTTNYDNGFVTRISSLGFFLLLFSSISPNSCFGLEKHIWLLPFPPRNTGTQSYTRMAMIVSDIGLCALIPHQFYQKKTHTLHFRWATTMCFVFFFFGLHPSTWLFSFINVFTLVQLTNSVPGMFASVHIY